jgi:hypothetical protein
VPGKSAAFSSSFFAHGLGGFELFRIGGFGIAGFLRDLSGLRFLDLRHIL